MKPIRQEDLVGFFPHRTTVTPQVGAELEVAGFDRATGRPIRYGGPQGICVVLDRLVEQGWQPTRENDAVIAVTHRETGSLTLEPGGQVELSTPPRADVNALTDDIAGFRALLADVSEGLDIAWIAIGLNPVSAWHEIEVVPKSRYAIMTAFLKKQGALALDMMRRTQSVHVTFDYPNEERARQLVRVTNCASPIVAAMFAHSPIGEGRDLGVRSERVRIWSQTDPVRCGLNRDAVEGTWSYARYLDWVLDVPLMFVLTTEGGYRDAQGLTGREYFVSGFDGQEPHVEDLEWIINQTFPDVRVRRYLECRGADMPPLDLAPALAALWTGLVYDEAAGDEALACIGDLTYEDLAALALTLAADGLGGLDARGRTGQSLALGLLEASAGGLARRGHDEGPLLAPLRVLVERGRTPADALIEAWHGPLGEDPLALIEHLRVA